ncbi:MAG: hydroxyacid dehydrogenase [Betaproteobacteria bacterium]|nr:hydroxyacid dehydrogenase [Betaproteobacteria bacterium]MDH3437183.1 hydroxyacid dehydrogenase [Betaproteobacteria bacterium]
MATKTKRLLLPDTMARPGWDFVKTRADVEAIAYSPGIPAPEFQRLLRDVDGVALTVTPLRGVDINAAPRLRAVGRIGVGYDAVDVEALTRRGIPLMTCGTDNSPTVAEYAMLMMLALCKRGTLMDALPRQGRWSERYRELPTELLGKTLLIIGFGRIGTRVARRCLAMEMIVEVYDPYVAAETMRSAGCEPVTDLDAALGRADFVTLHCPKTPETAGMFDAARLARMKPGARLINTARGGLVDEAALYAALAAGKLAGAGIDVFSPEPPLSDNPLFTMPNVIAAPHMAGNSRESLDRKSLTVTRNLLSVLDGKPNREYVVNPESLRDLKA